MEAPAMPRTKPMMTFVDAVKQCLRKYGDFSGRATRAECWWWTLAAFLGTLMAASVDAAVNSFNSQNEWSFSPVQTIFALAILLPSLAVDTRRLHDIGKSGWWLLVWYVIAIVGWIPLALVGSIALSSALFGDFDRSIIAPLVGVGIIALVINLAIILWAVLWLTRQGEDGPNRYGPDPRAIEPEPLAVADAIE